MADETSAGVGPRDRVFAEVADGDDGEAVALVKIAPGPVVSRRVGGVWRRDDALAARMTANRVRLRELSDRSRIAHEVGRWDSHEVDSEAVASGLYGPADRAERWERNARAGRRLWSREELHNLLAADVMAERNRATAAPLMASGAPRRARPSRSEIDHLRSRREARKRARDQRQAFDEFVDGRYRDGLVASGLVRG